MANPNLKEICRKLEIDPKSLVELDYEDFYNLYKDRGRAEDCFKKS